MIKQPTPEGVVRFGIFSEWLNDKNYSIIESFGPLSTHHTQWLPISKEVIDKINIMP